MNGLFTTFLLFTAIASPPPRVSPGHEEALRNAGLTLQPLSAADLDAVEAETGYRVGVLVTGVRPGSPAAAAGFRKGDVLLAAAGQGVDSPAAVDRALSGKGGRVPVLALRSSDGENYEAVNLVLLLRSPPPPGRPAGDAPAPGGTEKEAALRKQLEALEAARASGILTAEEYASKKARLEARLREVAAPAGGLDEDSRKRLEALDEARKAGVLDETEYARKRAAILHGRKASTAAAVKPRARGKVYRHPVGFSFGYPGGWSVREEADALRLIPPDPGSTAEGPTELYFIVGDTVAEEGIRRPDHPLVQAYLDRTVRSLAPFLRRTGGGRRLEGGKGAFMEWKGRNPSGKAVCAWTFCRILKGWGVALLAVGLEQPLEARRRDLERIFDSFGFSEGRKDPRLAGEWRLQSVSAIRNDSPFETAWSRAQAAREEKSILRLLPDGTWKRTDTGHTLAGAGGVWIEGTDRSEDEGRWYASDGKLYLISRDGSWQDFDYRIETTAAGRVLRLAGGGRGETWIGR